MYLIELNGQTWFRLEAGKRYIIGRDTEHADCILEDVSISLQHAELTYEDGRWWLNDLESEDGTYLGGEELKPGHKRALSDGARVGLGLKEFVFSSRAPLEVSTEVVPMEAASFGLAALDEVADGSQLHLSLLQRVSKILHDASDVPTFVQVFSDYLEELFQPSKWVIALEEEVFARGGEGDDPLAQLVLHKARYSLQPLAFASQADALVEDTSAEGLVALYAPLVLNDLVRGYVYLLTPPGESWSEAAFQLFASLVRFAGEGLSAFQTLRKAQEDREVLHLNLVGIAPEMQRLKREMLQLSQTEVPVFIYGEEGVGKTRIARAIHQASHRRQAPMMVLNAANFPKELFEVTLCGVAPGEDDEHGRARPGKIELAEGGSFLLEEIKELPLGVQPTLLAILKGGQYMPVGGRTPKTANVRMLFTSSVPINELIQEERLLPELATLLAEHTLYVPSLRQRKEDIPQLFRAFLGRFGEDEGLPTCVVSDEALQQLKSHRWTYNIRELRDIVARCFYELDPEHPLIDEELIKRVLADHCQSRAMERVDLLSQKVMELERRMIQEALMAANDDPVEAARALGISRVVLWRKIRALGIG